MSDTELVQRVERLERDNRRLKRFALAALVMLGAALSLGAARATPPVPKVIKAREFDMVNAAGATVAQMSMVRGFPRVQLSWPRGYQMTLGSTPYPAIALRGPGGGAATLSAGGQLGTIMHGPELLLAGNPAHGPSIYAQAGCSGPPPCMGSGPSVSLGDSGGNDLFLGSTNDVITSATGEAQQTSAASIVMLKDYRVVWQAPDEGDSK